MRADGSLFVDAVKANDVIVTHLNQDKIILGALRLRELSGNIKNKRTKEGVILTAVASISPTTRPSTDVSP